MHCGLIFGCNTPYEERRMRNYTNKIIEFIETPEGQKQYEHSRLKKYVDELLAIFWRKI